MKIKNLTDIPKEVFEPIYKKYSISESAKRLKISKGGVSKVMVALVMPEICTDNPPNSLFSSNISPFPVAVAPLCSTFSLGSMFIKLIG